MVYVFGLNLVCMREIVVRTDILVQASLSRLGKNSRSWPRLLLELSELSFERRIISLKREGVA